MTAALTWLAVGLAVIGSLSVSTLALRRLALARLERRTQAVEAQLEPVALALLAAEGDDLASLGEREQLVLAALLGRYSQRLSGSERARIAEFFESTGSLEREVAQLDDRREWKRATAAFALGDMASARAIAPLLAALDDREAAVRGAAARSLGRLAAVDAVKRLVHAFSAGRLPRAVAGQALLAIGPSALPALRELLDADEAEAREFAVELVGLLGDATDSRVVLLRLRDSSAEVRAKAARALGRLGAEEVGSALAETLGDRIPFVRVSAAHALAAVGDPAPAPRLLALAREDQFDPARAAAGAAARLDPAAVLSAAGDDDAGPHVREAADLLELTAR
jgi:HEAT repeat protein